MKKLILGVLAAGVLVSARADGHHGGGHWGGGHYWGGFGVGVASGLLLGAAVDSAYASPWYYDGYYPYYDYDYYAPTVYRSAPAVAPVQQQPAPAAQTQPTTIINNYNYYNSTPMSGANSLFGR